MDGQPPEEAKPTAQEQGITARNDTSTLGLDAATKETNFNDYRDRQSAPSSGSEANTPTPEQQRLNEAREQALDYVKNRLDLTGVDGKPLPTDAALRLIKGVHDEGLLILINQLAKKVKGEPIDEVAVEQGMALSVFSADAAYKVATQQIKQDSQAEMARMLDEIHANNPLTETDFLKSLFRDWPEANHDGGFDAWTKPSDPKTYSILRDGETLPTVEEAQERVRQARGALAQEVPTDNNDNAPQSPSGNTP